MRKDHRPYFLKRLDRRLQKFYTRRFLRPQFDHLGTGAHFMKPWHVEIFGPRIEIGRYATVIAAPDRKVRFSVWSDRPDRGSIRIGSYVLICPGVRMGASCSITIGDNCMFASGVYITDSDWHGIYNRAAMGTGAPVVIEENAWIGDQAIICKGVTVGQNSIVGAGAVVTRDVPPNVVAAGNPARVVKTLDADEKMVTRSQWLSDPAKISRDFDRIDRDLLRDNTFSGWIRYLLFPKRKD
ncbi:MULTISPECIES: acyltransferase [Desulfococcus]|jgi:acetyltransferase-like isoleucine patch superfamily enzyme|uniref:Transferase hexapeptide repeat containing protein n=1 Tax=Desulfococcus multivorans DSM 2059 TaxID=1121405 RepID=S7TWI0_DESML|nr:acyltransferase [Desulfococcus multivorans]AOY60334.1 transferase hexapeptide repeat containing protein [Desulfococcus multivorans]AQV02439.1 acetyltransferase [Desulfococcus multivorans]EPR41120.1 transferase hexapeptide repeat containing protein [Desulfococcus multivorans DSM 2059]MDX9818891.1 acyltransferase [Desulfococcus multivorans]SJZ59102.1 Acetyltransferase (isoleucine patch superfamily) [Desulfococcus multivorans DSM 2059]